MLGGRDYVGLARFPTRKDANMRAAPLAKRRSRRGLPMARYYFHVRRGRATILDNHGVEFVDLVEAANEATRRALQIEQREALEHASQSNRCTIVVDDEVSTIFEVPVMSWQKKGFVPHYF